MSKRRSLQVTAEQCSEFLKRPIPKVEDLNRNLRKSYGRNFFKGQTFEGLRQNAKKMRNQDDSVDMDIKVEQDSDFSVHKRKTRGKRLIQKQVKQTEVPVQIPKPKSPTQDLRSPSFSSSSSSSSQSGDQIEQNQSNKEENEQKSQQSGEVVKFQGQVGGKEPQSQQGEEKTEQNQSPLQQKEEQHQKPAVHSQYYQKLERHLREKEKAERQKMQNEEVSSEPESEQQDQQSQQNQQKQVKQAVEEKEQSIKGYKKNEIIVQIAQQQPKRNATRISKKELKLLLGSDQIINQNKEQVKPHHAARVRKARVIVRKPPRSPQKPIKPKQIKVEDSQQRQQTKELKRSKPIVEPTKVNIRDFIGEEVQKGVIYEAQPSKRNHQLVFCSKVIVDSLYIISNPNLPPYLKDWPLQSSVQSGIIRKKRIIDIQEEPQKEQTPIVNPIISKSMARKSAPVTCGVKLPKSRRRSSRRRR